MDVSVVLSTYNRCDLLETALGCLIAQEPSAITYEVIVVDNNSDDDTRGVVQRMARRSSFINYHFESRQGLSFGWNTGIAASGGGIIALTDDDLLVTPNYVRSVAEVFKAHPEVQFVGGKVWPIWPVPPPDWLTPAHWSPLALQDYGDTLFYTSTEKPVPLVNKAFRKAVFEQVGLFHTELGKVGEALGDVADHELMVRVWHAGGRGMYAPQVVVHATVQEERLTKEYHKKWHVRHGRLSARMALANPESTLFRRRVLGAPLSPYKRLFQAICGYPRAMWSRDKAQVFYYQNRMRYAINYLAEYYHS